MAAQQQQAGPTSLAAMLPRHYEIGLLVALALFAAWHFWVPPSALFGLRPVPDTLEYVTGARHLVLHGRFDVIIDGISYPPRYPPWFSLFILAPFYFFAPQNLGIGIIPIWLFAIAAVLAAFALGRRHGGLIGGVIAAGVLIHRLDVDAQARRIMTDLPVATLGLGLWLLYEREPARRWAGHYLLAGLGVAVAAALRPLALAFVLPFAAEALRLRPRRRCLWPLACLFPLPALLLLANAVYNHHAFHSFGRNGYKFWCPVPYDYLGLTFGWRFLPENLMYVWYYVSNIAVGVVGAALLWWRSPRLRRPLVFVALAFVPISFVHLFYFYSEGRFHLALLLGCGVLAGAGLGRILTPRWRAHPLWLLPLFALLLHVPAGNRTSIDIERWQSAQRINREAPLNAVIVSALDPVYLAETAFTGTTRRNVPVDRTVEYANKSIAWQRIPNPQPPPANEVDHRAPGILAGGARDVVPYTANEHPEKLIELARAGTPVYVDLTSMQPGSAQWKFASKLQQQLAAAAAPPQAGVTPAP